MANSSGGVGLGGLLTVLFVGLKLGHVIDWSWWWVFSPLWVGAAVMAAVFIVTLLVMIMTAGVAGLIGRRFLKGFRSE
jgi:hypothetical protein